MREIKFRAWDSENRKYHKPTYEAYAGNLEYLSISVGSGRLMMTTMKGQIDESIFSDRFIIEQYTGLHDKNGKEIYEGDIVADGDGANGIIEWNESDALFEAKFEDEYQPLLDMDEWSTVIGNVHENPELLNG